MDGCSRRGRFIAGFQSITIGNADGFPIAVDPQEVPGLGKVLSGKPGDAVPDSATMRDREYFQRVQGVAAGGDLERIYQPRGPAADRGCRGADF